MVVTSPEAGGEGSAIIHTALQNADKYSQCNATNRQHHNGSIVNRDHDQIDNSVVGLWRQIYEMGETLGFLGSCRYIHMFFMAAID